MFGGIINQRSGTDERRKVTVKSEAEMSSPEIICG